MQLFNKKDVSASEEGKNALQQKLEEGMLGLFEQVVQNKEEYYSKNSDKLPTVESIPTIVKSYATQNAVISGGAGLVPGPLGMLAIVPEITVVIKNQIDMIYDIGAAYGYKDKLTPELLVSLTAFALGSGSLGLLLIHGQKVLVKRASLRLVQKLVHLMAGKVSQRLLKSMVGKWIPIAGAVALAAWSKISTHFIANKAISVFQKEISFSDEETDEIPTGVREEGDKSDLIDVSSSTSLGEKSSDLSASSDDHLSQDSNGKFDILKIQSLINLMRIDGSIKDEEQEYIGVLIENSSISDQEKLNLIEQMSQSKKFEIDYTEIAHSPDDSVGLIVDLVGLAKRDGEFHIAEKLYIKQIGKILGISGQDLEEVMAV